MYNYIIHSDEKFLKLFLYYYSIIMNELFIKYDMNIRTCKQIINTLYYYVSVCVCIIIYYYYHYYYFSCKLKLFLLSGTW